MRVPEISLVYGYQPKINTIFAVTININNGTNKFKNYSLHSFIYGGAKRAGMGGNKYWYYLSDFGLYFHFYSTAGNAEKKLTIKQNDSGVN